LTLPSLGITFDIDQLRRERGELHGHLTVRSEMAASRRIHGNILLSGTTNLGSMQTRKRLGDMLAARALATDIDFHGLLEELSIDVENAEKTGSPALCLADTEPVDAEAGCFDVYGLRLPNRHPGMLYGMGDTLKSQIELLILGELQRAGVNTMLVDWEMSAGDHAARLRALYGNAIPKVMYVRAERALVHEVDRLQTIIHDNKIEYAAFDSVGFGCSGPPEEAESALGFMRAIRRLGIGSLLIAHQAKGEHGDRSPFGSAFWFNSCRVIYHVQRAEAMLDESVVSVACFPKKSNLYRRGRPAGLDFNFSNNQTRVSTRDVSTMDASIAAKVSTADRIKSALKSGPKSYAQLEEETGASEAAVRQAFKRGSDQGHFEKDATGRICLVSKREQLGT
jgi:hypothetical protein